LQDNPLNPHTNPPTPDPHPRSKHPWPSISPDAKDAVQQLMTWSSEARPSAKDMLKHEWIREGGVAGDNTIQPEVGLWG